MNKRIHWLWIPVIIVLFYLAITNQTQVDKFFQTTGASNYLLVVLIVVTGLGSIFTYYMEKKDRTEDKQLKHSLLIADNILRPLTQIRSIMSKDEYCEFWYIKMEKRYDKETKETVEEPIYTPIDILREQQRAFKWAFEHLEDKDYKIALDSWKNADHLRSSYRDKRSDFNTVFGSTLMLEMAKFFPQFAPYVYQNAFDFDPEPNPDNPNGYFIKRIKPYLESAYKNRKYVFPKFIVDRLGSGTICVTPVGQKIEPIIFCPVNNEDQLSVDKFYNLLNTMRNNESIIRMFNEYNDTISLIEENLNTFRKEINIILEKVDHLTPLSGKCELGY